MTLSIESIIGIIDFCESETFIRKTPRPCTAFAVKNSIYFGSASLEQIGTNHNGTDADEAMDVEAGQFEDAEEDP